jgi:hypothetical protein
LNGVLFDKEEAELIVYPAGKAEYSYIIPDGTKSVGYGAFDSCTSLVSVTIPASISIIQDKAFQDCTSLSEIRFNGTEEQWHTIKFGKGWDKNTGNYTTIFE